MAPAGNVCDTERVKSLKINSPSTLSEQETAEGWDRRSSAELLTLPAALSGPSEKLYSLILPCPRHKKIALPLIRMHPGITKIALPLIMKERPNQSLLVLSKGLEIRPFQHRIEEASGKSPHRWSNTPVTFLLYTPAAHTEGLSNPLTHTPWACESLVREADKGVQGRVSAGGKLPHRTAALWLKG